MSKAVAPSTAETAFSCPHCGAYTTQFWCKLFVDEIRGKRKTPFIPRPEQAAKLRDNRELEEKQKDKVLRSLEKMTTGLVGKDLNSDIKNLVAKGLDPIVQQSLDIVPVIGNESVHPGTIDLNDDRETAIRFFDLVNAIGDQMISHPKKVREMYGKLPESKRKVIEARDKKPPATAPSG